MDYLPVFLRLHAQPVVVVGGGQVALRKAAWLRKAGAHVTVVAPRLHPELEQQAARGELTHIAAGFLPAQLADAVAV
ncbi:MAG TPA: NAD(P)-dependent oxidoreductase, partial [Steroidobacteraceae bacterium]|nr:NAD(P)-dependent oxidoreductase [Steroidobacteraceae bacterium]